MVRQWQEILHGGRYSQSYSESLPDFVKLAEAFHCKGLRVTDPADLDATIREMIAHDGPVVVDVAVDKGENCFPMVPSGAAHNEMILPDHLAGDREPTVSEDGMAQIGRAHV